MMKEITCSKLINSRTEYWQVENKKDQPQVRQEDKALKLKEKQVRTFIRNNQKRKE